MNENQRKQILVEAVKNFGHQEWFRDASVYDKHPSNGLPTLELMVNYHPAFEKKYVTEFAHNHNLEYFFTVVDRNGRKSE